MIDRHIAPRRKPVTAVRDSAEVELFSVPAWILDVDMTGDELWTYLTVRSLGPGSAANVTAIAALSRYSEFRTRHALTRLEQWGLIRWEGGWRNVDLPPRPLPARDGEEGQ